MRKALLFCFNLKKSPAESYRMLVEAYGDNVLSETTCRDWFRRFNDDNFLTWVTRSEKIGPGRLKMSIAGSFGRGRYPIAKNACRAIGCRMNFLKQPFPCGYMLWGRFKRSENGCRMNWTIGRWSDAKRHAKFCLSDKKESRSCIGLCDEKWIYFQNPKRKKSWVDPAQPTSSSINIFLKTKSLRMEDDAVRLMGSGGCHLLRAVKTWWNC